MLARKVQEQHNQPNQEEQYQPRPRVRTEPRRKLHSEQRILVNEKLRFQCKVLIVVISALAVLITWRSSLIASKGYELEMMQTQAASIESVNAQMQIDIAKLKNPNRIRDIATQEFGMTVPSQVYFASEQASR